MLSDSAAKFIHDGLCAAFDIDPKGERMTAEQHTSIAHSDGDTPRQQKGIVIIASEPEWKDDDSDTLMDHMEAFAYNANSYEELIAMPERSEVRTELLRRLARPTPDQIRAAVYANCLGSSEVDDITKAIVSLFDAEVKL